MDSQKLQDFLNQGSQQHAFIQKYLKSETFNGYSIKYLKGRFFDSSNLPLSTVEGKYIDDKSQLILLMMTYMDRVRQHQALEGIQDEASFSGEWLGLQQKQSEINDIALQLQTLTKDNIAQDQFCRNKWDHIISFTTIQRKAVTIPIDNCNEEGPRIEKSTTKGDDPKLFRFKLINFYDANVKYQNKYTKSLKINDPIFERENKNPSSLLSDYDDEQQETAFNCYKEIENRKNCFELGQLLFVFTQNAKIQDLYQLVADNISSLNAKEFLTVFIEPKYLLDLHNLCYTIGLLIYKKHETGYGQLKCDFIISEGFKIHQERGEYVILDRIQQCSMYKFRIYWSLIDMTPKEFVSSKNYFPACPSLTNYVFHYALKQGLRKKIQIIENKKEDILALIKQIKPKGYLVGNSVQALLGEKQVTQPKRKNKKRSASEGHQNGIK